MGELRRGEGGGILTSMKKRCGGAMGNETGERARELLKCCEH
jgi:hypothetical protein